jgi:large subunit ribosomal protein L4
MRRLALKCTLSAKVADEEMVIIDDFGLTAPKTKDMRRILAALDVNQPSLLVTAESDINVVKSAHNLPRIKTLPASLLNVADLLAHRVLVMTVPAVRRVEELWSRKKAEAKAS